MSARAVLGAVDDFFGLRPAAAMHPLRVIDRRQPYRTWMIDTSSSQDPALIPRVLHFVWLDTLGEQLGSTLPSGYANSTAQ